MSTRPSSPSSTLHELDIESQCSSRTVVESSDSHSSSDKCYKTDYNCSTLYPGDGTSSSPYIVDWLPSDPENPYNWTKARKWVITMQLALCTFTVSFGSSSYTGGISGTMRDLRISEDVAILGISLYVLGFALGPLVFAPMGEMFGRRIVFLMTLSAYAAFQIGGSIGHNLATLLSCRLLSGIFGSSPLTNAGGAVSDIWNARERGLASAIYAAVPFLGPGPIVGGFVAQNPHLGWHFNFWLIFLFSVITLVIGYFATPETYGPVLLRKRAAKLSAASNGIVHYVSTHDLHRSRSFRNVMRVNLSRPFVFIATEPIVLLLAIYISIMYGTLYALFSGFPIVFQHHRGFTPGQSGLAFLGIGVGIALGVASQSYQDKLYRRAMDNSPSGVAPPEARLHTAIMGGILIPIGLLWFAWTSTPKIHWIVPILAGIPFGAGVAQILQSLTTYLMDTYPLYFASSIAATIVLRSCCGAAFPLFSPTLFNALGDDWAMSVFAFLALVCTPIPVLFFKYGSWIRSKSRVAVKDVTYESDSSSSATDSTLSMASSSQFTTIQDSESSPIHENESEKGTEHLNACSPSSSPLQQQQT